MPIFYRKAIEAQPEYAEAHCNLGHVLRDQGRLAEAIRACEVAVMILPMPM